MSLKRPIEHDHDLAVILEPVEVDCASMLCGRSLHY
jgi:hypothetical protein